jgi:hypothetical protein
MKKYNLMVKLISHHFEADLNNFSELNIFSSVEGRLQS